MPACEYKGLKSYATYLLFHSRLNTT